MGYTFQRILLVDDNEDDNLYHRILLQESGVVSEIDEVYNGQEAMDYLQCIGDYAYRKKQANRQPQVIFLDLQMPVMDGWEFIKAYRSLDEKHRAEMLVVLLTNSKEGQDVLGDTDKHYEYMSKPLTQRKIDQMVAHYKSIQKKSTP